jgi:general secretion pathway protein H
VRTRTALQRTAGRTGFTLIEVLVVMLIIGLVIAGAVLALGTVGRDTELERERDRLVALVAYVRERGAMLTLEYGMHCTLQSYLFSVYDPRQAKWTADTSDEVLRERNLPAGLTLRLTVEGHDIVLEDKTRRVNSQLRDDTQTTYTPQILLFSNGDLNSFALTLERAGTGRSVTLQSATDGQLKVGDVVEVPR